LRYRYYKVINSDEFTWDVSGNASFNSNKFTNFAGFVQTGGLNGQDYQVLTLDDTNDKPLYSYNLYNGWV
jgi:iron complex outermembrane receptor protein